MKLFHVFEATYSKESQKEAYVVATDSATALVIFIREYGDSGEYRVSQETRPLLIEGKQ